MMGGFGILVITGIVGAVFAGAGALVAAVARHPGQAGVWAGVIAGAVLLAWGVFWFCVRSPAAVRERAAEPQPDRWWEGAEYVKAARKQAERAAKGKQAQALPAPQLPPGFSPEEELAVIRAELRQQEPQPPPVCTHPDPIRVDSRPTALKGPELVAWLCPDCDTQLGAGFRASELKPDGSWPPVRRRKR
jgi:hypothetical protein